MLHNHDSEIHGAHEHRGIAHTENRRGIEERDIEAVLHLRDQVHHALRVEHPDRVERKLSARQEEKVGRRCRLDDVLEVDIGC